MSCYAVVMLLHMTNIVCSGGNLSVAVGPIGRNAEASGNLNKLAAMYSYSRVRYACAVGECSLTDYDIH